MRINPAQLKKKSIYALGENRSQSCVEGLISGRLFHRNKALMFVFVSPCRMDKIGL